MWQNENIKELNCDEHGYDYGSAIWGHFKCINAVHDKACQYFLGVGNIHQQMPLYRVI